MNRELEIRPIRESDIEALAAIEAKSFSMPWSAEDFREMITAPDALYLTALSGGEVVGSAGLRIICGTEGDIDNVVVEEAYRGRGIAGRLIAELLHAAREKGVTDFTLEVRVSNAPAIAVYEKAGFVMEGIRPNFYENPTENAAIYWLRQPAE